MNSINFLLAGYIVHAFPNYWCNTWIVNFVYESGNSCRWASCALHTSSETSSPTRVVMFPIGRIRFLDSFWRSLPPSLPSPSILRQTSRETSIYSASPFHEKPTTIHPGIIINRFEYEFNFFASSFLFLSSPLLFSKIETNCFEEEYTDPSSLRFIKDLNWKLVKNNFVSRSIEEIFGIFSLWIELIWHTIISWRKI